VNVSNAKPSMGMLRQSLFEILEGVKTGKIDSQRAGAAAKVAEALLHSVEVQIEFEKLRLDSLVPGKLPEMALMPAQLGAEPTPSA
jgi:hypothetical protein